MMRFIRLGCFAAIVCALCFACGSAPPSTNLSYGDKAKQAYEVAMNDFRDENCVDAEAQFRNIRRKYSYSRYAALAELRLADCMFTEDKFVEAIQAYRDFLRARPSHTEVPYAEFKIAEAYYKQIPEGWILSPPAYQRDQGPTRRALEQLRHYMMNYSNHDRLQDAKTMQRKALALLAQHELSVAEFYLSRDQPRAAIGRLQTVLNAYQGSGLEARAMFALAKTLLSLKEKSKAKETFTVLLQRYPKTEYAEQARSYLIELH
ncbi:MAG: outer membrane protein assembly factor BamD [Myxococcales bacterium]|nr:MAG: outer membrane protein assembly factor BamD [Myxococcales bacterium]